MSLIPELNSEAHVLICGASRGIGLALCAALLARDDVAQVWAVAREASTSLELTKLAEQYGDRLKRVNCDARNEQSLEALASEILEGCDHLHLVISTLGILHQDGARAEKGLAQLTLAGMQASFVTNTFAPILLLKYLLPLLRKQPSTFAALSARVGSIGDNRLGGWYSYRASKAALNQLLHTASIELKRLNPASTVLAIHPGTTDTDLSQPFQANVPDGQLFEPAFSADRIIELVGVHGPADSGSFWAWDDKPIVW
ncbi:Short-chain dehydrogenase/reductase SDR [Pseudomonas tremae]|uniref:SDR family NAD(P)-dependent oxidoreductase n=2 Tax=Pseudomonas syringae group TaxID=136849 RepID=A0AA40P248_9PSED|nr:MULTISPECIES: SDR family NAD(P)-dependent oxidoreductase [Pseudomonas syringae group]KGS15781.1 short-chain dehydrogenase [Pseudomonas coronafaciens]KPB50887.1 Short-chain dehydrogenase/reductase SDR [Pseudomonas coronafaciens pv. oryzae]KPY07168.1 Short-chain dehydrogenase/reductase SDR [Pseudomonas coronafaciens pv. oryzae]KPY95487.1 Short-chain dehydrogenase/reductase SDR [Pseudomonas tremae]KPZ28123.1 Short-chain dehydrogenase/reductase SDR [Pseudomonas coronafaciens pv. zizaniae]